MSSLYRVRLCSLAVDDDGRLNWQSDECQLETNFIVELL